MSGVAKELADVQNQLDLLTDAGQVFDHTAVPTMQACGGLRTYRTGRARRRGGDVEHKLTISHLQASQLQSFP